MPPSSSTLAYKNEAHDHPYDLDLKDVLSQFYASKSNSIETEANFRHGLLLAISNLSKELKIVEFSDAESSLGNYPLYQIVRIAELLKELDKVYHAFADNLVHNPDFQVANAMNIFSLLESMGLLPEIAEPLKEYPKTWAKIAKERMKIKRSMLRVVPRD